MFSSFKLAATAHCGAGHAWITLWKVIDAEYQYTSYSIAQCEKLSRDFRKRHVNITEQRYCGFVVLFLSRLETGKKTASKHNTSVFHGAIVA